jgi:hypothetical protein
VPLDGEQSLHSYTWDGTDAHNTIMATGLYFYRVKAGHFSASRKMLLMK